MSQIVKWSPFAGLDKMDGELATLIDAPFSPGAVAEWAPVVDIVENEKAFVIKAELPDVKKEDVRVQLEGGVLTIRGERKIEKEEKTRKYHRIERAYGAFARSFELPTHINAKNITARCKDGVLTVTVAKARDAKTKAVVVKIT